MPVTEIHKDPVALTMTVISDFPAPPQRIWQLWSDPRQLERWWGPPSYPATVVDHTLTPGGRVTYFMTGPDGERFHGWWQVLAVEAPHRLEIQDGFADDQGQPNPDMPITTMQMTLQQHDPSSPVADVRGTPGTRMEIRTTFPSLEAMEQMAAMGMEEGISAALSQIDDLLEPAAPR